MRRWDLSQPDLLPWFISMLPRPPVQRLFVIVHCKVFLFSDMCLQAPFCLAKASRWCSPRGGLFECLQAECWAGLHAFNLQWGCTFLVKTACELCEACLFFTTVRPWVAFLASLSMECCLRMRAPQCLRALCRVFLFYGVFLSKFLACMDLRRNILASTLLPT